MSRSTPTVVVFRVLGCRDVVLGVEVAPWADVGVELVGCAPFRRVSGYGVLFGQMASSFVNRFYCRMLCCGVGCFEIVALTF